MSIITHGFIEDLTRQTDAEHAPAPLKGEQIVILSHQRWNTHVTAVQNTAVRLARHNHILFIEPPDSLGWLLHEPPARAAMAWILDPLERKSRNLYVYHTPPLFLPGQARARWVARSVTATYEFMVRSAMSRVGFTRPIFWIYQFNTVWLLQAMRARFSVYECAEEWAANESLPHVQEYIRRVDEEMCRHADVVFVPSHDMLRRKAAYNAQTHIGPWGVDLSLYSRARLPGTPIPEDVRDLPRPIIGIVGMFDGRRLHIELLRTLAMRHPDWSIVLVGRCMPNLDTEPLRAVPNIHLFGMKPVEELPGYCKAFDVCMLPYHVLEFTRSIMPLKLVEYLATGKPVVTTPLPAAYDFQDVYYVAQTIDDFDRMVGEALNEDPGRAAQRVQRGCDFDWDTIVNRRMQIAAGLLRSRRSNGRCEAEACR